MLVVPELVLFDLVLELADDRRDVDVVDGTTLTQIGNITGSGSLIKQGGGTLVLGGTNSYSGGTTVSGGILIGTTASLQGDILNNAAVAFDQDTDGIYAGTMSGSGSLTKIGAGNLTLSGTSSYSGGTTVSGATHTRRTSLGRVMPAAASGRHAHRARSRPSRAPPSRRSCRRAGHSADSGTGNT